MNLSRTVLAAAVLVLAACGSSSTVDVESLGLGVDTQIQAGQQFVLTVPAQPDTTIDVVSTPAGVTASIAEADGTVTLVVNVEFDTPRGDYNLALLVDQDGEETELGWPFEVIEPDSSEPGSNESELAVTSPQVGAVVTSPVTIAGSSSAGMVAYLLTAGGDTILAEGTTDVVDGAFSVTVEFENTCCIEMTLEVFHVDEGGLSRTIPLTYPETS